MILIGHIVGPHGIRGTIKVKPFTDFLDRFEIGRTVKIKIENTLFEFVVEDSFLHKNFVCLKLKGIDKIDDALKLKNCDIVIYESELKKLNKDEYYIHDLIGLKVVGEDDIEIGTVTDIISLPSNDVYEIELLNHHRVFYPALKDYIEKIDIEKKIIKIKNYQGYFDSNDAI